jgi:hypothetical protein
MSFFSLRFFSLLISLNTQLVRTKYVYQYVYSLYEYANHVLDLGHLLRLRQVSDRISTNNNKYIRVTNLKKFT